MQNYTMKKPIKQIMSERLDYLMRVNPSLETLQKVADKSGVGYGTIDADTITLTRTLRSTIN